MSPYELRDNARIKDEFFGLVLRRFNFFSSFSSIPFPVIALYHRKKTAARARGDEIELNLKRLQEEGKNFVISTAKDFKKVSTVDAVPADDDKMVRKFLDSKCKESKRLLFFSGALFEATENGDNYKNSQVLLMLDVPTEEDVRMKRPITMYAVGAGSKRPAVLYYDPPPSKETVVNKWNWEEVKIRHSGENYVSTSSFSAYRMQYTMVQIGSMTVSLFVFEFEIKFGI